MSTEGGELLTVERDLEFIQQAEASLRYYQASQGRKHQLRHVEEFGITDIFTIHNPAHQGKILRVSFTDETYHYYLILRHSGREIEKNLYIRIGFLPRSLPDELVSDERSIYQRVENHIIGFSYQLTLGTFTRDDKEYKGIPIPVNVTPERSKITPSQYYDTFPTLRRDNVQNQYAEVSYMSLMEIDRNISFF